MAPHIANYMLGFTRLSQDLPLTIYLRYSKDARRREAKQCWGRTGGFDWICEPTITGRPGGRVERIAAALREGRAVWLPPDLPRKRGDGTPVRFFQREIYLPAGAAVLAVRSGAPLFTVLARVNGPRQRLILHGPARLRHREPGAEGEPAAVQELMQWFAGLFERFLTEQTPLWYFWGDKRWTRVLHGDPRYLRPLSDSTSATALGPSTGLAGVA